MIRLVFFVAGAIGGAILAVAALAIAAAIDQARRDPPLPNLDWKGWH